MLIAQKRLKLWTSNLAQVFPGTVRTRPPKIYPKEGSSATFYMLLLVLLYHLLRLGRPDGLLPIDTSVTRSNSSWRQFQSKHTLAAIILLLDIYMYILLRKCIWKSSFTIKVNFNMNKTQTAYITQIHSSRKRILKLETFNIYECWRILKQSKNVVE